MRGSVERSVEFASTAFKVVLLDAEVESGVASERAFRDLMFGIKNRLESLVAAYLFKKFRPEFDAMLVDEDMKDRIARAIVAELEITKR